MPDIDDAERRKGQLPGICLHCDLAERVQFLIRHGYSPTRALFDIMQTVREMAEQFAVLLPDDERKQLFEHLHYLVDHPVNPSEPIKFVAIVPPANDAKKVH